MPLIEEFEASGGTLFRWRSYLPLALVALIGISIAEFGYPLGSHTLDRAWELLCLLISVSGLAVRVIAIGFAAPGTSGRNTRRQIADVLNTSGMYSIVRHPLYLGNFLMALGVFLFLRVWWATLVYALAFELYYERIMFAEEAFLRLRFGPSFLEWAVRTPAFLPRSLRWSKPMSGFAWKKALRRETPSLFALCAAMFVLEMLSDMKEIGRVVIDPLWVTIASAALLLFVVTRIMHKTFHLLDSRSSSEGGSSA